MLAGVATVTLAAAPRPLSKASFEAPNKPCVVLLTASAMYLPTVQSISEIMI